MRDNLKKITTDDSFIISLLLFIACFFLAAVIPPFKSPDEFDHIQRAYLLGKGVFILDRPEGKSSGGDVDTGLLAYMASHPSTQDKLSADVIDAASKIRWTGQRVYDPAPGTGYYFPVIYSPQAAGLLLGERLGLTVDYSYRLARAFSILAAVLLVFSAFRTYATNPLSLALISVPMSLFQFSSASLDGVSTALALFVIATFLRITTEKTDTPNWRLYALAIAVVVLATSRIHLIPFVLMLAASFFYTTKKRSLFLFVVSCFFILAWVSIAVKTTVDLRAVLGEPPSNIIAFYTKQPFQFLKVFWQTITDLNLVDNYYTQFLGILGWLDTPFERPMYTVMGSVVLAIASLTFSWRGIKNEWPHRLLLIFISALSIFLIFLALLVTWSPHPASKISGVQGRYFLIPAILIAYGVSEKINSLCDWQKRFFTVFCFLFFVFSISGTTNVLLRRYYLSPFQQQQIENIIYEPEVVSDKSKTYEHKMVPSAVLDERSPIRLRMPPLKNSDFGKQRRIGILFGTYARQNLGRAELLLRASDGRSFIQDFSLSELADNSYRYFYVPADFYVSGEIRFLSGGGISVWENHSADGQILTCLDLLYSSNKDVVVAGCH
ncbi:DUF2142 domain-containing protein [Uliginosibacterium sp. H3]|uniref:DUF2142 domain-containing protein n=1 Tax=Uliginosibacterium silvisoli TaxID=3114758 RepID=A0ABU6K3J3_9RHOO|nr:DUF2142 domain-containing protein [Uliginosibacterium sp. H3]